MISASTLISAYPALPLSDQLHMRIRWLVCPLPAIAACVPDEGMIVDVGCGHGLFAQLLARQSARRTVIGVDLDPHKIAVAQQLALPNLRFTTGDAATLDLPPVQAVTIVDVFYLVPYEVQERLLIACAEKLAPGGVIVLKEMAESPRWKVGLNWLEEMLAVNVLRITASGESGRFYFRPRAAWQDLFARLGLSAETITMDHGYYHPHVVFVARK